MAQQEIIQIGAVPNDGQGDPLRVALAKVNNNFAELFAAPVQTISFNTVTSNADQVILTIPEEDFKMGTFKIASSEFDTANCQSVTLNATKTNNSLGIQYNAYGTIFIGTPVTNYDVDILAGNVRLKVSPFTSNVVTHLVAYQYVGPQSSTTEAEIQLDGYPTGNLMATEANLIITTE